jgi:anaerobic ribonucleoside-triphosphate reductase activating protein
MSDIFEEIKRKAAEAMEAEKETGKEKEAVPDVSVNIAGIVKNSIVDGPGIRYAIFTQGCPHNCPGCHNPETNPFGTGTDRKIASILAEIDDDPLLEGITLSGGEAFCQPEPLVELCKAVRARDLDIFAYSGWTYEELMAGKAGDKAIELLELCDYLVDGRYVDAKRDLRLQFRGSSNQRIIDLNKTREKGDVVLSEYMK